MTTDLFNGLWFSTLLVIDAGAGFGPKTCNLIAHLTEPVYRALNPDLDKSYVAPLERKFL